MRLYCPVCKGEIEHLLLTDNSHRDYQQTAYVCNRCKNAQRIQKRYYKNEEQYERINNKKSF